MDHFADSGFCVVVSSSLHLCDNMEKPAGLADPTVEERDLEAQPVEEKTGKTMEDQNFESHPLVRISLASKTQSTIKDFKQHYHRLNTATAVQNISLTAFYIKLISLPKDEGVGIDIRGAACLYASFAVLFGHLAVRWYQGYCLPITCSDDPSRDAQLRCVDDSMKIWVQMQYGHAGKIIQEKELEGYGDQLSAYFINPDATTLFSSRKSFVHFVIASTICANSAMMIHHSIEACQTVQSQQITGKEWYIIFFLVVIRIPFAIWQSSMLLQWDLEKMGRSLKMRKQVEEIRQGCSYSKRGSAIYELMFSADRVSAAAKKKESWFTDSQEKAILLMG